MAELAAGYTGRETEVADRYLLIYEGVGEVVRSFGHGSNKHTYALLLAQCLHVISNPHQWGVKAQSDFAAVRRQVIGDGILDDFQELLLRVDRSDCESVEELYHKASEPLEGTGNPDGGAYFNEDSFGGVDVNLKLSCLVDRRIEQRKETLRIINKALIS